MKNEIYLCSCQGEGISVDRFDENEIYMAFWKQGLASNFPLSFKQRLRWIWQILIKGEVWNDEVVLTDETARELGEHLLKITSKRDKNLIFGNKKGDK